MVTRVRHLRPRLKATQAILAFPCRLLRAMRLRYRYPISWALANASVRFLAPSLTMADDR
jgi:hypothetical protein